MALLEVEQVSVRFGGNMALQDVDLSVDPHSVTGLIGPNGAGKTTLFNVVTGLQAPTTGRVRLNGIDITSFAPHSRAHRGLARTFQRIELFGSLSVRENLQVAAEVKRPFEGASDLSPRERVDETIELVAMAAFADRRADHLTTGQARIVELGRALVTRPKLVLLDEPASGLDAEETEAFAAIVAQLSARGMAVLLVEHDVPLVMRTCQEVYVLDFGRIIAQGGPEEIRHDPKVIEAYLGTPAEVKVTVADPSGNGARVAAAGSEPPPLLELRDVRAAYGRIEVLHGVNLTVPEGKVVALLGPNGAGKTTTISVCSGVMAPTSGGVVMAGRLVNGVAPDQLARAGVCTIPEGRGIFPNLTVRENLQMMTYTGTSMAAVEESAYHRFPRLQERRTQVAGTLSGGEQQMLALARGLASNPALLLLDELSMGLAPLVVEELYGIVAQIAKGGVSILVVEQFARTVLGVADVAAIMLHGEVIKVGPPEELEDELSAAYLGGAP